MLAIVHASTVTALGTDHQVSSFCPHGNHASITALCWNHSGQAFATCATIPAEEESPSVVVTGKDDFTRIDSFQHDPNPSNPTSLCFGGRSRYLCISDALGTAGLWDLKKKSRVRRYHPSELPCLQTIMNDTHVYTLTTKSLFALNIKEGTLATTIQATSSPFIRHLLLPSGEILIGTQNGHVELHSESDKAVKRFKTPHRGAVLGLALLNTNVMASCCAGGILCFTHLQQETTIQSVQFEMSLTCLSIEGNQCAVGSDTGKVQLFHIRNFDKPLFELDLEEAITTLAFAPTRPIATTSTSMQPTPGKKLLTTPTRKPSSSMPMTSSPFLRSMGDLNGILEEIMDKSSSPSSRTANPQRLSPPSIASSIVAHPRDIQEMINTSIEASVNALRDDVSTSIRNLHIDMIRQFHEQHDHISSLLRTQNQLLERLVCENEILRRENTQLLEEKKCSG